jgi:hypothetical protein
MKEVKRYSGYELIKALKNNEISTGTKLYIEYEDKNNSSYRYKFYTIVGEFKQLHIWREEKGKEDVMLDRVLDTEDLTNSAFVIYEKEEEYSLNKSVRILSVFLEQLETVFEKTKINNTKERDAIKSILNIINKSLIIPKKDLKEIKDRKEKENLINEEYNKETRSYLMNVGQICLCEVLEYKYGGNIENE